MNRPEGVTYTDKQVRIVKDEFGKWEAQIGQADFVKGRMEHIEIDKIRGKSPELECSPIEKSEFKSGCGSLQWVAGLTRPDAAYGTNALQKKQAAPRMQDLKDCNKLIKQIQAMADAVIRIRPLGHKMVVGVRTDSALYTSVSEEIENDEQLKQEEKHKVRSQAGCLVSCYAAGDDGKPGDIATSILDWRTRATKRVVISIFAAETSAACDGLGLGMYLRLMPCEIYHGAVMASTQWSEDVMPVQLLTDCKSVYDHLARDSKLPDDRWTALQHQRDPDATSRSARSAGWRLVISSEMDSRGRACRNESANG